MSDSTGDDDKERGPRKSGVPRGRDDRNGRSDSRSGSGRGAAGYGGGGSGSGSRREGGFNPRSQGDRNPTGSRFGRDGERRPQRDGSDRDKRDDGRPQRSGGFAPRRDGAPRSERARDDRGQSRGDRTGRRPFRDGERDNGQRRRFGEGERRLREGRFPQGSGRPGRDDERPRRDGGFQRRDGDRSEQRRGGEFRPRREGGFSERRESRPRREGGYERREDRAGAPRREGGFRPGDRRDGGARPRREDGQRPWSRDRQAGRSGRDSPERQWPEELRSVRPRHDDPEIPESVTSKQLDFAARVELRTLSKDNAEEVARHLVMAGELIDSDPELAHRHALSAARRAGRVAIVRETLAITAYATGDFALALRELRTYRRISGKDDQLPLMVDSERGVGRPERALELGRSVDRSTLSNEVQASLAIAMSGARLDLGQPELALAELEIPQLDPDVAYSWSPALFQAYGDVLDELGRGAEAQSWWDRAEHAEAALDEASDEAEHETMDVFVEESDLDELASADEDDELSEASGADEVEEFTAEDEVAELLGEEEDGDGAAPQE